MYIDTNTLHLLDINHRTQLGNKYRLDCGAAMIAMLANVPINQVLIMMQRPLKKAYTFSDIYKGLDMYKLPFEYLRGNSGKDVADIVRAGYPVISLINYGLLPKSLKSLNYKYDHFVVIYGADQNSLYWHDPLSYREKTIPVPFNVYDMVSSTMAWSNIPRQIIKINKVYGKRGEELQVDPIDRFLGRSGIEGGRGDFIKAVKTAVGL